jgi:site-specific recombinase XerD
MASRLWVAVFCGPLARCASGCGSWLSERGYSRWTVAHRLWQLDLLSRWLEREGLPPDELTRERVVEFSAARRAAGYSTWLSVKSMALPLEYLRELGVVPADLAPAAVDDPIERLLTGYGRYLLDERGLTEHTVFARYVPAGRLFLGSRVSPDGSGLEQLSGVDVSLFMAAECPKRSVSAARDLTGGLRSFLRWLYLTGAIPSALVWAVPTIADPRDSSLPRGLDRAVVRALLESCDRRRTVGRRDCAILLLLLRLGLRAGEVAAITLDDIDWRAGELLVRNGKGRREERLPLPADVGEAIVSYLHRRPRTRERALFLRLVAPAGAIRGSAVSGVVRSACRRAGLSPSVGSHALRHTAALEMLRAGATLVEIGEVLRHQEPRTTARYAKVDRKTLRQIARPWPQSGAA